MGAGVYLAIFSKRCSYCGRKASRDAGKAVISLRLPTLWSIKTVAILENDGTKAISMTIPKNLGQRRREFQNLHDSLVKGTSEHFEVWFHDVELLDAAIPEKTEAVCQCIIEINEDRTRYREIIQRVAAINVAGFSPEELKNRNGEASRLLDMATEISALEIQLPRKVEKLAFLL